MENNKMIKKFEVFNDYLTLIHITSPDVANLIKRNGFIPTSFIDYKYYSNLGKDGIYFYDNLRQAQLYAGFFMNKSKLDKVALIKVKTPSNIILKSNKIEDGFFIKREDLNKIEIIDISIKKYTEIY
jgi:hypothetical protein